MVLMPWESYGSAKKRHSPIRRMTNYYWKGYGTSGKTAYYSTRGVRGTGTRIRDWRRGYRSPITPVSIGVRRMPPVHRRAGKRYAFHQSPWGSVEQQKKRKYRRRRVNKKKGKK